MTADMEIRASRQHGQGLVCRVATEIRPQIHGMLGRGQEPQISSVGVVHHQQNPEAVADRRQTLNICRVPQIVGGGQIHRRRKSALGIQPRKLGRQTVGRDGTGQIPPVVFGEQPFHVQIQQPHRRQKGLVGISPRQDQGAVDPPLLGVKHDQIQHGADALGRPLGGVVGGATEEQGSVALALTDDAVGLVETVGPRHLGDVVMLTTREQNPLVARHMEAKRMPRFIGLNEIHDGGCDLHVSEPCIQ